MRTNWLPTPLPTYPAQTVSKSADVAKPINASKPEQSFREVLSSLQTTSKSSVEKTVVSNTSTLKVSAHAAARMQERGVALSESDWNKVSQAVETAAKKGSRDAYVMYGQTGFVVNVPNRTVITTMSNQTGAVVTNIDSVVVVPRLDRVGSLSMGTD